MNINDWLLPSLLALLFWGVSMFVPKLAVRSLSPLYLTVYSAIFTLLSAVGMMAFYGFQVEAHPREILLAVLTGVLGRWGSLMYVYAIRNGPMTYGAVITSLYPIIAAALSFLVLHEKMTLQQTAGIALGVFSLVLMIWGSDDKAAE